MAAAAIFAGCGSYSPPSQAAATPSESPALSLGRQVAVNMTEYHFSPNPIHVAPGPVVFQVINVGLVGHDFTVLTQDGHQRLTHTPLVSPGSTVTLRLDLTPGTYPVVCTQPGHQESGMEARIEVG